jgi:hypothetical protein
MEHPPDQTVRAAGGDASGRAPVSDFDNDTIWRKPPRHFGAWRKRSSRPRAEFLDQNSAEEKEALREVEKIATRVGNESMRQISGRVHN